MEGLSRHKSGKNKNGVDQCLQRFTKELGFYALGGRNTELFNQISGMVISVF